MVTACERLYVVKCLIITLTGIAWSALNFSRMADHFFQSDLLLTYPFFGNVTSIVADCIPVGEYDEDEDIEACCGSS